MVAVPETLGVHWKTFSGEVPLLPQLPASALAPEVVPGKVPPAAGITVGLPQVPPPSVVVVALLVVVVVVVAVVVVAVVVVAVGVVVVVVAPAGGVTVRLKVPAAPL